MLWTKGDSTSSADSFVNIFTHSEVSATSTEAKTNASDEDEYRAFAKRSKHYEKRFEQFAKECREVGKTLFGQKQYVEAMQEFNRCLMFARPGSEEVALAYANRSACFFYLNMPTECLADIELAQVSNYPEHLMEKLNNRASKCKSLANAECKIFSIRYPTLDFQEHAAFAGVAACLEIRTNEFGRHVIATCDLEIGQTILVERPFSIASTQFGTQKRNRCLRCFRKFVNFITCSDCLVGFYCNADCMQKDFHATECSMDVVSDDKEQLLLIVKTFLNVNAAFADVDVLVKTVDSLLQNDGIPSDLSAAQRYFCMIFQLKGKHEHFSDELLMELKVKSETVYRIVMSFRDIKQRYTSAERQCFVQHLILHLCYISRHAIELNEYIRTDSKSALASYTFEHYATALYPFGSYIRHSCIPNISWLCVDDRLVCKVLRPIEKGEEVFRSYFLGMASFMRDAKSKKILDDRYQLICKCHFCSNEMWSPLVDRVNLREDPLWKEGIALIYSEVTAFRQLPLNIIESHEKKAIEFLAKYNDRHPVRDTISMQEFLHIIWNEVASLK